MILRGIFVKAGEEAFAFDSLATEKLAEMGLREVSRDPENGDRTYRQPGVDSWRVVRTAGGREGSVVSFGAVRPEALVEGKWAQGLPVDLETFIREERPFRFAAAAQLLQILRPRRGGGPEFDN